MQRSKQQALAFLLGAVLVGGVVGFSADRVFRTNDNSIAARRQALYDDLDLKDTQRAALDPVFDASNCQLEAIFKRCSRLSIPSEPRRPENAIHPKPAHRTGSSQDGRQRDAEQLCQKAATSKK